MLVAYDITQTGHGKAGCGYYAHSIVESIIKINSPVKLTLMREFGDFYYDHSMVNKLPYKAINVSYFPNFANKESSFSFWSNPNSHNSLNSQDIVHSNNFWCPGHHIKNIFIYTLYDVSFLFNPEWTTEENRLGCFQGVLNASLYADWIVAISEFSKKQFIKYFPYFPSNRIKVIYPASRFRDLNIKGIKSKIFSKLTSNNFWLSVSTIEPRKNQITLLNAYQEYLNLGGDRIPLVFAGANGWLMDDFIFLIRKMGLEENVIITGYVTDDELIWLYRNCYSNLYPSFYEGFGLPVLEGMQFGASSIISNTSSLPEVGGSAAIYQSPEDTFGWAKCMFDLRCNQLHNEAMRIQSKKNAFKFDWEQSASLLIDLYKESLANSKNKFYNEK